MSVDTPDVCAYQRKLKELLDARDAAGGELPDEEESRFCEELDGIWWTLSNEEQETFEKNYAEETR